MPNSTDVCLCAHGWPAHDPGTTVCRYAAAGLENPCGCAGFCIPGNTFGPPIDGVPTDTPLSTTDGDQ